MILYHKPRTRFSIDPIRYGEPKRASYRSAPLDHPLSVEGVGYRVGFEYDDKIWNSSYSERYEKVSVRAITDEGGEVLQRMNYTPYGRLAHADGKPYTRSEERMALHGDALMFGRGYTGHEHLLGLGLINMNACLYDPYVGRFLSPDPYVQLPDFSQNFNRYSYCLNNPLSFTDPTGEIVWFIPAIAAVIGGVANLVANWDHIEGFWDAFSTFAVGAGAGAATAATGGAGAGVWAVAGVSAAGGAMVAMNNDIVAQTGENFSGFSKIDWGQTMKSTFVGSVAGAASGATGYWASNASFLVNNVNSPILRSAVVSPLASGAGHLFGGTAAGLLEGYSFGDSFINSFDGLGSSMIVGGALGVASTIGVSYASGVNPWTGRFIMRPTSGGYNLNPDPNGDNITLYRGTSGSEGDGGGPYL